MIRVIQFLLLSAFWLVLSGMITPFHLMLGLGSVAIAMAFNWRITSHQFYDERTENRYRLSYFRLILFLPHLAWEIILSSVRVARLVLNPDMPVKTAVVHFRSNQADMRAKVFLGNCITLTPGTVTMEIDGDDFTIHALTDSRDPEHVDLSFVDMVASLYSPKPDFVCTDVRIITSGEQL